MPSVDMLKDLPSLPPGKGSKDDLRLANSIFSNRNTQRRNSHTPLNGSVMNNGIFAGPGHPHREPPHKTNPTRRVQENQVEKNQVEKKEKNKYSMLKEAAIIGVLCFLVNVPYFESLVEKLIPSAGTNRYIMAGIKALVVIVAYMLLMKYYFKK